MKRTRRLIVAILCIALLVASTLLVVSACESKCELTFALGDHAASGAQVPDKQTLAPGETITLPQAPDAEDGWEFDGWGSDKLAAGSEYQMPESDTTLTAQWKQINTYAVTITKTPEEGGTVSLDPQQDAYFENTKVVATVTPATNFAVKSVKANGSDITPNSDGKYEFTVSAATTLAVEFEQTVFAVSASVNYEDGAELTLSSESAKKGDTVTLSVTVKEGYVLESVKVGGQAVNANGDGNYEVTVSGNTEFVVTLGKVVEVTASVYTEGSGTVTLSAPTHNGKYYAGDEVTISFEVDDAYDFETLAINDDDVDPEQIVEGSYTFTVTEDTEVVLYANKKVISADLLQSLSGAISGTVNFVGKETDTIVGGDGDPDIYDLSVIFDSKNDVLYQEMLYDGQPIYIMLGQRNEDSEDPTHDGILVAITHDIFGRAHVFYITDSNKDYIPFEAVTNPFGQDVIASYSFVSDGANGAWVVDDNEVASDMLYRLTGFAYDVESFKIFVDENGEFEKLEIITAEYQDRSGTSYVSKFEYTIGDGNIPAEWLDDYSEDIADADLAAAFNKAASATSYKASYSYTYYDEDGSEQTDEGNVYVTAQAIYDDMLSSGVFKRADGSCWAFTYEDETFTTGEQSDSGFASYLAQFGDFNLSMMEKVDDNTYRYRFIDSWMLTSYLDEYDYDIGVGYMYAPVPGDMLQTLFMWAYNLTITLDEEGNIATVVFDTSDDEHVEVTFSGWNSTTLPFEIPASEVEGSIPVEMVGVWTDENAAYEFEITIDGTITAYIVGEDGKTEKYTGTLTLDEDLPDSYSVSLGGVPYAFAFDEDGAFCCYLYGSYPVELAQCNWGLFFGSYYGEADSGESYLVDITFKGITITVDDGEPVAVTDIEFGAGIDLEVLDIVYSFSFTYNEQSYWIKSYSSYEGKLLYMGPEDYQSLDAVVVLQQVVTDWKDYEGTFHGIDTKDVEYTIEIIAADKSVTLTIGEDEQSLDALLLWVVTTTDNNEIVTFKRFEFTANGVFGVITPYGSYVVYNTKTLGSPVYLGKVGYSADWSSFIGEWSGTSTSNVKYAVNITADQVTLAVGEGEAVEAIVLEYDDVYGFTLSVNGEIYYIQVARDGLVYLYGSTGSSLATLYKSGLITPEYQGTWYSDLGDVQLYLGANEIQLYGEDAENIQKTENGYSFQAYDLEYELNNYTITLDDKGVITLTANEQSIELFKCNWHDYLGQWDSGTAVGLATNQYTLVVHADGKFDLTTPEGSEQGDYYYFGYTEDGDPVVLFSIGQTVYQLQLADIYSIAMFDISTEKLITYFWMHYVEEYEVDYLFSDDGDYIGIDDNDVIYTLSVKAGVISLVEDDGEPIQATVQNCYMTMNWLNEIPYGVIECKFGEKEATLIVGYSGSYVIINIDGASATLYGQSDVGSTDILASLAGVYTGEEVEIYYGFEFITTYQLRIEEDGDIFLSIDEDEEIECKLVFIDAYEGLHFIADGSMYYFFVDPSSDYDEPIFYLSDGVNFKITVTYSELPEPGPEPGPEPDPDCEWADLIGTWTCTDEAGVTCTVVVTSNGVSVDYGDLQIDVTKENNASLRLTPSGWLTWSDIGGWDSYTVCLDGDQLNFWKNSGEGDGNFDLYLSRQEESSISWSESYNGVYEGTTDDGHKYVIEITSDTVSISVDDGPEVKVKVTAFDDYYGFTITYEGKTYYIVQDGYGDTVDAIVLNQGSSFNVKLDRKQTKPSIGTEYRGTWTGVDYMDNDVELVVGEFSVSYNGSDVLYYFDSNGQLVINHISDWTVTVVGSEMTLTDGFNTFTLTKNTSLFTTDQIGTYTGTDMIGKTKTVTVVITENGITINGEEATNIVEDDGTYTFECNGVNYSIEFGGGQVVLMAEDSSEIYNLDKQD